MNVDIKTRVVTQTTATLELNADQVETIVRNWAIKSQGFKDPEVESYCSFDGMFNGMTLTDETSSYSDDSDTPVEGG